MHYAVVYPDRIESLAEVWTISPARVKAPRLGALAYVKAMDGKGYVLGRVRDWSVPLPAPPRARGASANPPRRDGRHRLVRLVIFAAPGGSMSVPRPLVHLLLAKAGQGHPGARAKGQGHPGARAKGSRSTPSGGDARRHPGATLLPRTPARAAYAKATGYPGNVATAGAAARKLRESEESHA